MYFVASLSLRLFLKVTKKEISLTKIAKYKTSIFCILLLSIVLIAELSVPNFFINRTLRQWDLNATKIENLRDDSFEALHPNYSNTGSVKGIRLRYDLTFRRSSMYNVNRYSARVHPIVDNYSLPQVSYFTNVNYTIEPQVVDDMGGLDSYFEKDVTYHVTADYMPNWQRLDGETKRNFCNADSVDNFFVKQVPYEFEIRIQNRGVDPLKYTYTTTGAYNLKSFYDGSFADVGDFCKQ